MGSWTTTRAHPQPVKAPGRLDNDMATPVSLKTMESSVESSSEERMTVGVLGEFSESRRGSNGVIIDMIV